MISTLGFLTIDDFVSNVQGAVNPVGELSGLTKTYDRDVKLYNNAIGTLNVFTVLNANSAQLLMIDGIHTLVSTLLANFSAWSSNTDSMLLKTQQVLTDPAISDISVGNAILNFKNSLSYPQWIDFIYTHNGVEWHYKIWLVNAAFEDEYPRGQYEFIMPLSDMQTLYTNYTQAKVQISELSIGALITKAGTQIHAAITGYHTLVLRVYNVHDMSAFFDMTILVAYNGGHLYCNTANYLNTLGQLLVQGGSHTLEDWLVIIPTLVPVNKYYIGVNWGNTAISNGSLATPIGSPTIAMNTITLLPTTLFADYTSEQLNNCLDYSVAVYKSLGFYVVPDLNNPEGVVPFKTKFADYFLALINDVNINQMASATQYMVVLLDQLIRLAEVYSDTDILPDGVTIEVKNTYVYISKRILNVSLCVATRKSVLHL